MRGSSVLLVDGAFQHFRPYVGAKIGAVFAIVVNSLIWKNMISFAVCAQAAVEETT